jgi:succinoglycan biosynthesis transport protein ExoP
MSFEQLIAVLRARWLIALSTFVLVLGTVIAITLLWPKNYTAASTVLLDVKPDPILGAVLNGGASSSYMMTQIDIITSRRVAENAARALKLTTSKDLQAKWRATANGVGDFDAWVANLIRGGVEARPSRGSNVITVTYTAADPAFAAALANAFVQGYLDVTMDLRTGPAKQYSTFFDSNARQIKEQLEKAQTKLSDFQKTEGLLVTDERLDIETMRLNELSTQLVGSQAAVADSGSRQSAAQSQGDKSPDVMNSPLVATLKSDLVRAETQLEQLTTRLGDQHPTVLELKSTIAETRRKLDAEVRRVTSSVGVGNSVNVSRTAQIKASLEEQRAKVFKLKSARDQAGNLQRDVDNAQRSYDSVLARLNTTNLESQSVQANVSVLESATPPDRPSSPRIFTNVVLGGFLAVVLSMVVTFLYERFDRRLRTEAEIEDLLAQPLIGVIPSFKKLKSTSVTARLQQIQTQPRLKALTK